MKIIILVQLALIFSFLFQPALLYANDDPKTELETLYEKSNEMPFREAKTLVSHFELLLPKIDFSASEGISSRIIMVESINRKLLFSIDRNDRDSLVLEPKILQVADALLGKIQFNIDKNWTFIPVPTSSISKGYGADLPEEAHFSKEEKKTFKQAKVRQYYLDLRTAAQVKNLKNRQQVGLRDLREDVIRCIASLRGRGVSNWNAKEFMKLYGKDPECERIIEAIFE